MPSWRRVAPCTRAVRGQLRARSVLEIQRVVACLDLVHTQLLRRAAGAAIVDAEARTPGPAAAVAAVAVVCAGTWKPGPAAAVAAVAVVGAEARTPRPAAAVAAVAVVGAATWKPGHAAAVAPIVVAGATARHPSPSIIRSSAAAIVVAGAAAVAIVTAVTAAAAAAAARRRPAGAVHAYRAFRAWGVALPADVEALQQTSPDGRLEEGGGGKDKVPMGGWKRVAGGKTLSPRHPAVLKTYVEDPRPATRTSAPRICRRHSLRALASAVSRWMEVKGFRCFPPEGRFWLPIWAAKENNAAVQSAAMHARRGVGFGAHRRRDLPPLRTRASRAWAPGLSACPRGGPAAAASVGLILHQHGRSDDGGR